jgi:hypothetical protein
MPIAVTGVLFAGRCGPALFQREIGDLTLRTLTRGRRGGSSPSRTARPIRALARGDAADHAAGCGDGLQGDGEAGPVGVGARHGLGGQHHFAADRLVEGQQRPVFLFEPGRVL